MSEDPTAIQLHSDPTLRRFRGIAIHGDTPFDVPFISEIAENLWMGGCEEGLVLPRHIRHVVSLYPWEAYQVHHDLKSHMSVRLYDDSDTPDDALIAGLAAWVNVARSSGPTLVHCQAGLNRSGMVVAASLIQSGMSAHDAIALLREKRSPAVLCNATFEAWLHGFGSGDHGSIG